MGGVVGQILLWTRYQEDIDVYHFEMVTTGVVLNRSGRTYVVTEYLHGDSLKRYKAQALKNPHIPVIKVDRWFLGDIEAAGDKLYPELIGRINDKLRSYEALYGAVLDTVDTSSSGKKDASIDVLLIGDVGHAEKAVGLKRVDGGFLVCRKADNSYDIEDMKKDMKERAIGKVLIVDGQTIATLSKRRNARIGSMLAQQHCDMVKKLLAQESQES